MIDLHCHLLPGIDDGPATMAEAVDLARLAVSNGIKIAFVTPHIQPGLYENNRQNIEAVYLNFKSVLKTEQIPLQLGMAAEVRISPEILAMVAANQIPFLGEEDGYKYLLLELPHGHIPPGSDKMVDWLLARNIKPVIAHPERNKDVLRKREKIRPFVQQGCLLQVTAGSVAGQFGPQVQECANELLQSGWVTILASDAHNLKHRPPALEAGRAAAAEIIGEEASWQLVQGRPEQMIKHTFNASS